jgi:hypothetical protein
MLPPVLTCFYFFYYNPSSLVEINLATAFV